MNIIVAGRWLLSCLFLMWGKKIMEQDQAKHYLKEYGVVLLQSCFTGCLWSQLTLPDTNSTSDHLPTPSHRFCAIRVAEHQVWQQASATVEFCMLYLWHSNILPLMQQTRCSHFHSFKSSSASAGPNITPAPICIKQCLGATVKLNCWSPAQRWRLSNSVSSRSSGLTCPLLTPWLWDQATVRDPVSSVRRQSIVQWVTSATTLRFVALPIA